MEFQIHMDLGLRRLLLHLAFSKVGTANRLRTLVGLPTSTFNASWWDSVPTLVRASRTVPNLSFPSLFFIEKEKKSLQSLKDESWPCYPAKNERRMSHVIAQSRMSDRARGRYRSCDSQSFCKKSLELYQNQPAVRPPLSGNFTKKPSTFLEINPQSNSHVSSCFAKKSSDFKEINPRSGLLSQEILRKNPQSFSKSTRSPTVRFKETCKENLKFP